MLPRLLLVGFGFLILLGQLLLLLGWFLLLQAPGVEARPRTMQDRRDEFEKQQYEFSKFGRYKVRKTAKETDHDFFEVDVG